MFIIICLPFTFIPQMNILAFWFYTKQIIHDKVSNWVQVSCAWTRVEGSFLPNFHKDHLSLICIQITICNLVWGVNESGWFGDKHSWLQVMGEERQTENSIKCKLPIENAYYSWNEIVNWTELFSTITWLMTRELPQYCF